MQVAYRYDIGSLKSPRRMPDGRLVVDAKLTRTGVFLYANPDGTARREFRSPEEVFDQKSLDTFPMTSVTNDHPHEMVNVENAQGVTIGMVVPGSVRRIEDHVAAELVIFDAKTIADVEGGKEELSCGYEAEVTDVPGVSPTGEHFDSSQTNIRINHVAIVDAGRAGPEARIRMDAAVQVHNTNRNDEINAMELQEALKKIAELEVAKATEAARADRAESALTEEKARADKAEADRDVAADKTKVEAERADKADASINDRVNALAKLRADAAAILPDDEDKGASRFDEMSDREIKVAVIKTVTGFEITDTHTDVYVDGRFDGAVAQAAKADDAMSNVRQGVEVSRTAVADSDPAAAQKRMTQRHADASKGKA